MVAVVHDTVLFMSLSVCLYAHGPSYVLSVYPCTLHSGLGLLSPLVVTIYTRRGGGAGRLGVILPGLFGRLADGRFALHLYAFGRLQPRGRRGQRGERRTGPKRHLCWGGAWLLESIYNTYLKKTKKKNTHQNMWTPRGWRHQVKKSTITYVLK